VYDFEWERDNSRDLVLQLPYGFQKRVAYALAEYKTPESVLNRGDRHLLSDRSPSRPRVRREAIHVDQSLLHR
jgi:hypothetical protein